MSALRWALLGLLFNACFLSFSTKAMSQSVWQKEWARSLDLAKKEGEVQIYGPHNPLYLPIWALFQKVFPEVKIKFIPGKGSQHAERIAAEWRAGKYLVDIVMGGQPLMSLIPKERPVDLTGSHRPVGMVGKQTVLLRPG